MKTFLRLVGLALICTVVAPASAQYALQFGAAVAVSGDEIIVGEGRNLLLPGTVVVNDVAGDGTWSQTQVLTPPDADGQETSFGRALAAMNDALMGPDASTCDCERRLHVVDERNQ